MGVFFIGLGGALLLGGGVLATRRKPHSGEALVVAEELPAFEYPAPEVRPPFVSERAPEMDWGAAIARSAALVTAAMGMSPFAPLTPFAGPILAVLGGWATDAEKARVAQPRLNESRNATLQGAEFAAYMEHYQRGRQLHGMGRFRDARAALEAGRAAGRQARAELGAKVDAYELECYRLWMKKPRALFDNDEDHLYRGWQLGDGGFTGSPYVRDVVAEKPIGLWVYRSAATGRTWRFHWSPSHPDYNGYEYPEPTEEQRRKAYERWLSRTRAEVEQGRVSDSSGLSHPPTRAEENKRGRGANDVLDFEA